MNDRVCNKRLRGRGLSMLARSVSGRALYITHIGRRCHFTPPKPRETASTALYRIYRNFYAIPEQQLIYQRDMVYGVTGNGEKCKVFRLFLGDLRAYLAGYCL